MKIPWKWIIIGMIMLGIGLYLYYSGMARGALNKMIDQLRVDQGRVVEVKEQNEKMYEDEISRLQEEVERNKKDKEILQGEKAQVANERDALKGWIRELQTKKEIIVVSDDPNTIIGDLRKHGFPTVRHRD